MCAGFSAMQSHASFFFVLVSAALAASPDLSKHAATLSAGGNFQLAKDAPVNAPSGLVRSDAHTLESRTKAEALSQTAAGNPGAERHKILITGDATDRELSSLCTDPRMILEQKGLWECVSGGFCVRKEARCNGVPNCQDGSDEAGCENGGRRGSLHAVALAAVLFQLYGLRIGY